MMQRQDCPRRRKERLKKFGLGDWPWKRNMGKPMLSGGKYKKTRRSQGERNNDISYITYI